MKYIIRLGIYYRIWYYNIKVKGDYMKKLIIIACTILVVVLGTYTFAGNKVENTSLKYINIVVDDLQDEMKEAGVCVVSDVAEDIDDIDVDLDELTDEQKQMIEENTGINVDAASVDELNDVIEFTKAVCVLDADKASFSFFDGVHIEFSHHTITSRYAFDITLGDAISLGKDYKNIDPNKLFGMLKKVA